MRPQRCCWVSAHPGQTATTSQPLEEMMCRGSWDPGDLQHTCASLSIYRDHRTELTQTPPSHLHLPSRQSCKIFFPLFWCIFFHIILPISMNEKYFPCTFSKALFWYLISNINSTFQSSRISLKNVTLLLKILLKRMSNSS